MTHHNEYLGLALPQLKINPSEVSIRIIRMLACSALCHGESKRRKGAETDDKNVEYLLDVRL